MIGLQSALAAMGGQPLGTLGRLRAGLTGIALAVPGVGALSSGIAAIGAAVATISAPVWATFAAVAAAVAAAGFTIYRYWDRITATLSGVGQAISERLQGPLDWLGEKLSFLTPITEAISNAFSGLGSALGATVDAITGFFSSGLFEQEVLSEEEQARIAQNAANLTGRIIDGFAGLVTGLYDKGIEAIQALWDGMVAKFEELIAWIRGIPSRIVDAIGNIDLSNIIRWPSMPAWLGGGDEVPAVAVDEFSGVDGTRAAGGPISRGGTYLVGERGPELITANRNGYVNPAGSLGGPGAIDISVNAPITISGATADPQQLAAEITRQLRDQIREAFRGVYADTGLRFA